jgi:ribonuclease P protein component
MKSSLRLKRRSDYALVYREGMTWLSGLVVMKAKHNRLACTRYGFSVTKRLGNAVQRNRLKRLLREIVGLQPVKPGWDIVFIARPIAVTADYHQLEDVVTTLLAKAQLLGRNEAASFRPN